MVGERTNKIIFAVTAIANLKIYALPISAEMVTREGIVVIAESEELNQCNLGQLKN
jgi:hypothetical protein